jgi:cytochrome c oxidase assembly protein subunit 15
MDAAHWREVFAKYQTTREYQDVNRGMSLDQFKGIYWWEWSHRLLGRLVGAVILVPFLILLALRRLQPRLIWRCAVLIVLIGIQGAIGWWMVKSGLSARISVAPEWLTFHLASALIIFLFALWTGLEAWGGMERLRPRPPRGWVRAAGALLGAAYLQCLLGALVAGNRAGFIYNDWPLMNGKFIAPIDWKGGPLHAFLHDPALVQLDHRFGAYLLFLAVWIYAVQAVRSPMPESGRLWAAGLGVAVTLQACLGIATLMAGAPLWLGLLHQAGAVIVLALVAVNLWRTLRMEERFFTAGIGFR